LKGKLQHTRRRGCAVRPWRSNAQRRHGTWVAITDPIPGRGHDPRPAGLGRDSQIATQGERKRSGSGWPAFEERSFEGLPQLLRVPAQGAVVVEDGIHACGSTTSATSPCAAEPGSRRWYAPEMFRRGAERARGRWRRCEVKGIAFDRPRPDHFRANISRNDGCAEASKTLFKLRAARDRLRRWVRRRCSSCASSAAFRAIRRRPTKAAFDRGGWEGHHGRGARADRNRFVTTADPRDRENRGRPGSRQDGRAASARKPEFPKNANEE